MGHHKADVITARHASALLVSLVRQVGVREAAERIDVLLITRTQRSQGNITTVSYTHLTLPTNINFRSDTEPNGAAIKEEIDPVSIIDLDRHGEDVPPSAVSQSSLAPTPIACDNQAVVAASGNPETSQRTRHLDMRYFKVRDLSLIHI